MQFKRSAESALPSYEAAAKRDMANRMSYSITKTSRGRSIMPPTDALRSVATIHPSHSRWRGKVVSEGFLGNRWVIYGGRWVQFSPSQTAGQCGTCAVPPNIYNGSMTVLRVLLLFLIPALPAQAKLKVFILADQSNMEGTGQININSRAQNKGAGTLEFMVKTRPKAKAFAEENRRLDRASGCVCKIRRTRRRLSRALARAIVPSVRSWALARWWVTRSRNRC